MLHGTCETITNDPNGVISMRNGEFDNEIHQNGLPGTRRDVEGLEKAKWFMKRCFDVRAYLAHFNIVLDVSGQM